MSSMPDTRLRRRWHRVRHSLTAVARELSSRALCGVTANKLFSSFRSQPWQYLLPGSPIDFKGQTKVNASPAPLLGQHNEQVLSEVLALDTSTNGSLVDRNIALVSEVAVFKKVSKATSIITTSPRNSLKPTRNACRLIPPRSDI